nr:hypothetical protein DBT41_13720 [Aerococcus urinae]
MFHDNMLVSRDALASLLRMLSFTHEKLAAFQADVWLLMRLKKEVRIHATAFLENSKRQSEA